MGILARRWAVRRAVNRLQFPRPFSLAALLAREAERTGTPLQVVLADLGGGLPTEMVVRTAVADYLILPRGTSDVYVRHLIFHALYRRQHRAGDWGVNALVIQKPVSRADKREADRFARLAERKLARHMATTHRLRHPMRAWDRIRLAFGAGLELCRV